MTTFKQISTLHGIETNGEALSVVGWPMNGTKGVVRKTHDGQFALIEVDGAYARLHRLYDDLYSARLGNLAHAH